MKSIIDYIKSHSPDKIALEDTNNSITYEHLYARVIHLSKVIEKLPSRTIGLYMDNSILWIIISLAIHHTGKTIVPIPLFFSAKQIAHIIEDCGLNTIITVHTEHDRLAANFNRAYAYEDYGYLDNIIRAYQVTNEVIPDKFENDVSVVTYTSGSTDQAKGVCLNNESLLQVAESIATVLSPLSLQRHLCSLPLSTLLENIAGVWAPLISGSTVITIPIHLVGFNLSNSFDIKTFTSSLYQYEPDSIILLPEMLKLLVGYVVSGKSIPKNLKFCAVGGAKVNNSLLMRAHELNIPAYEGYGLSECASVVSLNTPHHNKVGTSGKPLPHNKVRITPDSEIEVAGSTLCRYLNEEASYKDSYFPTGDIGQIDNDGYLIIQGRKKNMFITSYGRQICPDWIESILVSDPYIRQAAIYGEGLPNNISVIVPSHKDVTPTELEHAIDKINEELPDYARIHDFIITFDEFNRENGHLTVNNELNRDSIWNEYLHQFHDKDSNLNNCINK